MQALFEDLTEYFNIASQMVEAVDPDASICVVTCGGNSLFTVVPQYATPKSAEHHAAYVLSNTQFRVLASDLDTFARLVGCHIPTELPAGEPSVYYVHTCVYQSPRSKTSVAFSLDSELNISSHPMRNMSIVTYNPPQTLHNGFYHIKGKEALTWYRDLPILNEFDVHHTQVLPAIMDEELKSKYTSKIIKSVASFGSGVNLTGIRAHQLMAISSSIHTHYRDVNVAVTTRQNSNCPVHEIGYSTGMELSLLVVPDWFSFEADNVVTKDAGLFWVDPDFSIEEVMLGIIRLYDRAFFYNYNVATDRAVMTSVNYAEDTPAVRDRIAEGHRNPVVGGFHAVEVVVPEQAALDPAYCDIEYDVDDDSAMYFARLYSDNDKSANLDIMNSAFTEIRSNEERYERFVLETKLCSDYVTIPYRYMQHARSKYRVAWEKLDGISAHLATNGRWALSAAGNDKFYLFDHVRGLCVRVVDVRELSELLITNRMPSVHIDKYLIQKGLVETLEDGAVVQKQA